MVVNSLLAIIGLLVAGFSMLSESKRLDLLLRLTKFDIFVVFLLFTPPLIIVYSPVILSTGLIEPIPWILGFNEHTLTFSCLVLLIILCGLKLSRRNLPKSKTPKLENLMDRLLSEKAYDQLTFLIRQHHEQMLHQIKNPSWKKRLSIRAYNARLANINPLRQQNPEKSSYIDKVLIRVFHRVSEGNKIDVATEAIITKTMKSKAFLHHLSGVYPTIVAKFTSLKEVNLEEESNEFIYYLFDNKNSQIYSEIKDNQTTTSTGEYCLNSANAILSFYLSNVKIADRIKLYTPVMECVISEIKANNKSNSFYNRANPVYSQSRAKWDSPIFIGIEFYKIMMSCAIKQKYPDHLWHMYVVDITKEILKSIERPDDIDLESEFPAPYDYYIYHAYSGCEDWVKGFTHDPNAFDGIDLEKQLSYWAAQTFGQMTFFIFENEIKLGRSKLVYYLEICIDLLNDLDARGWHEYSDQILTHMTCYSEFHDPEPQKLLLYKAIYYDVDHVKKDSNSTFEITLNRLINNFC